MSFWGKLGKGLAIGGSLAAIPFSGGSSLLGLAGIGAKVAPMVGAGISALGGALANKGAKAPTTQQQTAQPVGAQGLEDVYNKYVQPTTQKSSALADEVTRFSQGQASLAMPGMQKAMQHYMDLASGDRNTMQSAIAPSVAAANSTYSGAQRGLSQRLAPGPQRDRAMADIYKQRAGQIGMMPFQAQEGAYGKMGDLANQGFQNAMTGYGQAGQLMAPGTYAASNFMGSMGNLYGGQQQIQAQKDIQGKKNWFDLGSSMGQVFLPYLMGKMGAKKGTP